MKTWLQWRHFPNNKQPVKRDVQEYNQDNEMQTTSNEGIGQDMDRATGSRTEDDSDSDVRFSLRQRNTNLCTPN